MNTLTQKQIFLTKQLISIETGRFTFDISDNEVFERITDYQSDWNTDKRNKDRQITWSEAAEMCQDDWGICNMLGYC